MKRCWKVAFGLVCLTLVLGLTLPISSVSTVAQSGGTWYVDDDGTPPGSGTSADPFATIQGAVDSASPGDTIVVRDGTYVEHVDVHTGNLTIQSENGANSTIVQASDPSNHVFLVSADYVSINGFTIRGNSPVGQCGVFLEGTMHCSIEKNEIQDVATAIHLSSSSNQVITSNRFSYNWCGIGLYFSNSNSIADNTASNNTYGMYIHRSSNNLLRNNALLDNTYDFWVSGSVPSEWVNDVNVTNTASGGPIYYWIDRQNDTVPSDAGAVIVVGSSNITVKDLTLTNGAGAIHFAYVENSEVENVRVANSDYGILLEYSGNNSIVNSVLTSNGCALGLAYSSDNSISGNDLSMNWSGISLFSSSENNMYLNDFIGNSNDVLNHEPSANTWHSHDERGYTYNGSTYSNYLGNYWSDYTGIDANGDGIGDSPYPIDGDADYYPLIQPVASYSALAAEASIFEELDNDSVVVIPFAMERIKDASTGETVPDVYIDSCQVTMRSYPSGIEVGIIRPGNVTSVGGCGSVSPDSILCIHHFDGVEPPFTVQILAPHLVGCAEHAYTLEVSFDRILDVGGHLMRDGALHSLTFQRGDINGNGAVDIIDAMFGASYLVGNRAVETIAPLNMASVRYDGPDGDRMDIIDCMYIAQYVVGLRDCFYEVVP